MKTKVTAAQIKSFVIAKETEHYRIVTDDPDNWSLVANRPIRKGELVVPPGSAKHIDVSGVECVDVILEETGERRRVLTDVHAVPNDSGCTPAVLVFPWCFINHSCGPNVGVRWNSDFLAESASRETEALRDIPRGEELTYDYALEQFDYRSPFQCQCGHSACRGKVSGFRGLFAEQQEEMLSSATPYVQQRYQREAVTKPNHVPTHGRHLIADFWNCDVELLDDEPRLKLLVVQAAEAAGATVMSLDSHRFEHQGVTVFAVLAESHLAIHTWPEAGYAGVDMYTCGSCDPQLACEMLARGLAASRSSYRALERGLSDSENSIQLGSGQEVTPSGLTEDHNWFFEGSIRGPQNGTIHHRFQVSEILFHETTRFQECLIFESPLYGRVMALDGIVQFSTSDEFIYHEMMVHPAMFSLAQPGRVLIVGGDDGGALREVLKHDPERVVMVDIDEQVIRAAAEHLPSLSSGAFSDPRVSLLFDDASQALTQLDEEFDVAIIDCNRKIGPVSPVFESDFYSAISRALTSEGICAVQAGPSLEAESLQQMRYRLEKNIGQVTGYRFTMPCFHCGESVILGVSKTGKASGPEIEILEKRQASREVDSRYWSPEMHFASQVLPPLSKLW